MQHRFLPIFSNFAAIALAALLFAGCAAVPAPEEPVPTAIPTASPTPSAAVPEAAATPAPVDYLAAVTADTPVFEHPYYWVPVPTVREGALPPLTCPPASADRESDTVLTCGNYDYIRYDDGTAGLVGCHFDVPTHVFDLPAAVDGLTVTGLEPALAHTFEPATQYTPRNDIIIRIPKTVRYIGCNIAEAEMLHDITVEIAADSPYFQSVGNSIFSADGTLLHSHQSDPMDMHPQVYIVPDTVTAIGADAFYHFQELIAVRLPEGLRSVGASAFEGCENLSHLVLPASLQTVGDCAFSCYALTLTVSGKDTDLGTEPDLDAIALICSAPDAKAAAYAALHEIPHSDETPLPLEIAIDPATKHLMSYQLRGDGTAKLIRIHSNGQKEFTLPETIGGIPVTAIGHETLLYINEKHEDYPVRIRVPACITEIDAGALWPEVIIGEAGSAAERFAEDEGIEFIAE